MVWSRYIIGFVIYIYFITWVFIASFITDGAARAGRKFNQDHRNNLREQLDGPESNRYNLSSVK